MLVEFGKSLKDVVSIIDPKAASKKAVPLPQKNVRRAFTMKAYKNPHSGEVVETKGGNHKTLEQWKAEHGGDVVES